MECCGGSSETEEEVEGSFSACTRGWGKSAKQFYEEGFGEDYSGSSDDEEDRLHIEKESELNGDDLKSKRRLEEDEALHLQKKNLNVSEECFGDAKTLLCPETANSNSSANQTKNYHSSSGQSFLHPISTTPPIKPQAIVKDQSFCTDRFQQSLSSIVSSLKVASAASERGCVLSRVSFEEAESDSTQLVEFLEKMVSLLNNASATADVVSHRSHCQSSHKNGLSYLDTKNRLLLKYLIHVIYFVTLRCHGLETTSHQVTESLMQLKTLFSKLTDIDAKLRYPIQRILAAAKLSDEELMSQLGSSRPRPGMLGSDDEEDSDRSTNVTQSKRRQTASRKPNDVNDANDPNESSEDDQSAAGHVRRSKDGPTDDGDSHSEDDSEGESGDDGKEDAGSAEEEDAKQNESDHFSMKKRRNLGMRSGNEDAQLPKAGVYKPKKLVAVEYTADHVKADERARKNLERQKNRLRTTALVRSMRSEVLGSQQVPEEIHDSRQMQHIPKPQRERELFEEEYMTRLQSTKKQKKDANRLRKASRLSHIGSTLADLVGLADETLAEEDDQGNGPTEREGRLTSYLNARKQVKNMEELSQKAHVDSSVRYRDVSTKSRKSRSGDEDEDVQMEVGGDDSHDRGFGGKSEPSRKAQMLKKIREDGHRLKANRGVMETNGFDDEVPNGGKRGVSRAILKNRGLTRFRNKKSGNSRVHNRIKFVRKLRKTNAPQTRHGEADGSYAGEIKGMKSNVVKSLRLH